MSILGLVVLVIGLGILGWILSLRRVVNTNEVHIVQSKKNTVSYGKGMEKGNTYYEWPSWLPFIGIQVVALPVSVFSQNLQGYEAYDQGRLPFVVDITAFFRIDDSNTAAQRVYNFQELLTQLESILQGAARTILASKDIEEIMQGRSEFGTMFTKEVTEQLKAWGVTPVKNIELMDIRDSEGSKVIKNIMEKKKSFIEMESRKEVALNNKLAQNAEIDATREVELNKQVALQQVGIRTAEKEREVGIATQQSQQEVKMQEKITAEKQMEVVKVNETKTAEITKEVFVIKAKQEQETSIIKADGEKQKTILIAEGNLSSKKLESEGIKAEGEARALAEEKMQLAPVNAQITLAKEIGENAKYQEYLITIRRVEAEQMVGIEQAHAVGNSKAQIIVNSGDVSSGIKDLGGIFSSKGGMGIASALEALGATEAGKALVSKITK